MKNSLYQQWTKVCALTGLMAMSMTGLPAWGADVPGLAGPRYFADMQLKDGAATMPAAGAHTEKMIVDTGAPFTIIKRAGAKSFELLKADDTDNGYSDGNQNIGGVGAGAIKAQYSKKLSILAKGKKKDGTTDAEPNFTKLDDLRVVYPKKGEGDLPDLLGTNYMAALAGGAKLVANPDGSCTFAAPPAPPKVPVRKTGLQLRATPGWPDGFGVQYIVPGLNLNGVPANFVLTTGSPYTVISSQLAATLGLRPMGTYDLYNADPDAFAVLVDDGFFDNVNPGPLGVAMVSQLTIPTDDGAGVAFANVPVLINPFPTPDNVFGSNILVPSYMATQVNLAGGYLEYVMYSSPSPTPTPTPTPYPAPPPTYP
jgi:predicted aspartyl protease